METRYLAIVALALSLGGIAMHDRVAQASRIRECFQVLHQEQPELNTVQRVLLSLALTGKPEVKKSN